MRFLLPLVSVAILFLSVVSVVGCSSLGGPEQGQAQGSSKNEAPSLNVTVVNYTGSGPVSTADAAGVPTVSVSNVSSPAAAPNASAAADSKQDSKQDVAVDPEAVGNGVKKIGEAAAGGAADAVKAAADAVKVEAPADAPK